MARFYERLGRGDSQAEALRRAQTASLADPQNEHRHPFYWAGFQIVGDGQGKE
jgi:CHAT domain-containing protein